MEYATQPNGLNYTQTSNESQSNVQNDEQSDISARLFASIDLLLQKIEQERNENEALRSQITLLRAQEVAKNNEIETLYNEIAAKETQLEELLSKIQNVLNG